MGFLDKLDKLMKEKNINKSQLAKESGVPYTTIDGFYKKGTENIKLSTLKKLVTYFGCSLDYLADDDVPDDMDPMSKMETSVDAPERYTALLDHIRDLNDEDIHKVLDYIEYLQYLNRKSNPSTLTDNTMVYDFKRCEPSYVAEDTIGYCCTRAKDTNE